MEKNISEQELELLEKAFIEQVREDLNVGDYTAISEMLNLLVLDEKALKIIKAYLPE